MVWKQIVFGTIVTRGPRSPLASNAIKEFDETCVLFTKVAKHSRRAAKALVRLGETGLQSCSLTSPLLQPILTRLSEKAHNALAACQKGESSGQFGQQWSVKEEVDDDELEIFSEKTRFVSTRRLSKSKQASEGLRGPGFVSCSDSLPEPSVPQLYRPESSASSVDRWARTKQDQLHYPARDTENYPYPPQHHPPPPPLAPASQPQPAPQHAAHEHSTMTTPYSWAQQPSGVSSQFSPETCSAANRSQSHGYPDHPRAYEQSSAPSHQQPQWAALSETTEPGLVSQESWLDEHSTVTTLFSSWAQQSSGISSQFSSVTYSAANSSQLHGYPDHPHTYGQSSAPPYQQSCLEPSQQTQTQPAQLEVPPELTELGLVSPGSWFDERWTSYMHDSGVF